MTIAKALIMVGLLFPVPVGYGLYYSVPFVIRSIGEYVGCSQMPIEQKNWWFNELQRIGEPFYNMPIFGNEDGYWWPILVVFAVGLILSGVISYFKSTDPEYLKIESPNLAIFLFALNAIGVIVIAIFWAIVFAVIGFIGFVMAFIVKPMFAEIVVSVIVLVSLFGVGVYGVYRYKKAKRHNISSEQDNPNIGLTDRYTKPERWMQENNISEEQLEELRATRHLRKLAQSKKRNKK